MSGEGVWWDDASKENTKSLRERFKFLESSAYASPRITMKNDSVGIVAERAPPLVTAIIIIAIGIITPFFINTQFGPLESLEFILLGVIMLVFSGAGAFYLGNTTEEINGFSFMTLILSCGMRKVRKESLTNTNISFIQMLSKSSAMNASQKVQIKMVQPQHMLTK